ncbi:MAG: DUF4037 domain-containing protein [bacterium]|nr:DUF4037 domain-containing protein [bacterium]
MLNKETMVVVEALLPLLRRFVSGPYGIAVGGAHAKSMADPESDLDVYVFAGAALSNSERTRLTVQLAPDTKDVVSWGSTTPFEQAGTDFYLGNLKIECWLRNTAAIERMIDECVEGVVRRDFVTWTTTGFYNHCCLSDMNKMIPVDDSSGILARWKRRIGRYPPRLRDSIIRQHLGAARFWPNNFHYRSAIERQDVIYTAGIVQQVVHNLIQTLFAANEVYFAGDKKLSTAIARLNDVPAHFSERVQRLLFPSVPVSVDALRSQQEELQQMVKAVEDIVSKKRNQADNGDLQTRETRAGDTGCSQEDR